MKSNYEKLSEIIKEAEELLKKDITKSSTEFKAWKMKAERYLISCFGETSHEYSEFKKLDFTTIFWGQSIAQSEYVTSCHEDIKTAIAIFKVYLEEAKEESTNVIHNQPMNYSKVFIVHGHDGELKESVARVIEKQGIEAIILSEHSNQGRTVIEKFENYSDVGGTICLFTADDFGRAKDSENDSCRARQNVVFEAGYFMGKKRQRLAGIYEVMKYLLNSFSPISVDVMNKDMSTCFRDFFIAKPHLKGIVEQLTMLSLKDFS